MTHSGSRAPALGSDEDGRDADGRLAREAVRAQLQRILDSPAFEASERRRRFLRYIVEESLAGRADQIKEYSVGVEVFDRPADYDPRIDSIVRVEARRLRTRLAEYYEGEGKDDALRFRLPKGGYAPTFEHADVPIATEVVGSTKPRSPRWWIAGAACALLVLAVAGYRMTSSSASSRSPSRTPPARR